jgi:hypothetical protein
VGCDRRVVRLISGTPTLCSTELSERLIDCILPEIGRVYPRAHPLADAKRAFDPGRVLTPGYEVF